MKFSDIFLDWTGQLSWLRVAATPVILAATFGLVYSIVIQWAAGAEVCLGVFTLVFGAKFLQTKIEASSATPADKEVK